MANTTLVVMAAGMGSRFGGLKQMEPIGSNGEVLLDFSVYDARKAGFNKVVFIIKQEMEQEFRAVVGNRIEKNIDVEYVFQTMEHIPEGRTKPWGTGHAVLCCKDVVKEPFAVINADDYYGRHAFLDLHRHLEQAQGYDFCMVGYELAKTLTENGTVARGVCEIQDGLLKRITERTKIKDSAYTEDGETWIPLPADTRVSMNLWGFTPVIFEALQRDFQHFLETGDLMKGEFFLPFVVDDLIQSGKAQVKVIPNPDKWYGMTYREDKDAVVQAMQAMIKEGYYDGI